MKAILVLEMPKCCYDCPLLAEQDIYGKTEFICKGYESIVDVLDSRAEWCPLRPLPEYQENQERLRDANKVYITGYKDGYNVYRDEIMGEEE